MNRAVFLDRDGVITREPPYYAHRLDQLAIIPRVAEAIRLLNDNGFKTVIISNQAGIGRGYYTEKDAEIFNRAMKEELAESGGRIDAVYICPHLPDDDCDCRKPRPGLLKKAETELDIDMTKSFLVGDKRSDIEAGRTAGVSPILVKTGQGQEELAKGDIECDFIADDLYSAAKYIRYLERKGQEYNGPPAKRTG